MRRKIRRGKLSIACIAACWPNIDRLSEQLTPLTLLPFTADAANRSSGAGSSSLSCGHSLRQPLVAAQLTTTWKRPWYSGGHLSCGGSAANARGGQPEQLTPSILKGTLISRGRPRRSKMNSWPAPSHSSLTALLSACAQAACIGESRRQKTLHRPVSSPATAYLQASHNHSPEGAMTFLASPSGCQVSCRRCRLAPGPSGLISRRSIASTSRSQR